MLTPSCTTFYLQALGAAKGSAPVVEGSDWTAHVGLSVTANAAGFFLPHVISHKGKVLNYDLYKDDTGSYHHMNTNGWDDVRTYRKTIDLLSQHVVATGNLAHLLYVDGAKIHHDPIALEMAIKHNIMIIEFTSKSSHKMQPLDRGVFGTMKKVAFTAIVQEKIKITEKNVASVFARVLAAPPGEFGMGSSHWIKAGFKKTGLFPFNEHHWQSKEFFPSDVRLGISPDHELVTSIPKLSKAERDKRMESCFAPLSAPVAASLHKRAIAAAERDPLVYILTGEVANANRMAEEAKKEAAKAAIKARVQERIAKRVAKAAKAAQPKLPKGKKAPKKAAKPLATVDKRARPVGRPSAPLLATKSGRTPKRPRVSDEYL